jgi:glutamate N-acetyltransferase/amino-acid N-acetyltransferase
VSVTGPAGFRAAGVAAGLKNDGHLDLALVVNDGPLHAAAAVFTSNRVQAAPVLWSRQAVRDGRLVAVVLNSGGANACTGSEGFADTHRTAEHVAAALSASGPGREDGSELGAGNEQRDGVAPGDVAVCSTGLIGERLPMDLLSAGVDVAVKGLTADAGGAVAAAEAIRTTDTVPKTALAAREGWSVGGMAKGAGMLAPGLATMLAVLTTDAVATPPALDGALRAATRTTFDRVDSDGCMSTNDTVLLLASGASGTDPGDEALSEAVHAVCADLARQLVADAEGAGHDIAVEVVGARTEDDAVGVARAIARSNLFKTAVFGNDPNWGRVLAAVGTTRAAFEPDELDVAINGVQVCRSGGVGEDRAGVDMSAREVRVVVDLHAGDATATVWTNDLTHDYVHENSAYST